jgi:hypothetical protein
LPIWKEQAILFHGKIFMMIDGCNPRITMIYNSKNQEPWGLPEEKKTAGGTG